MRALIDTLQALRALGDVHPFVAGLVVFLMAFGVMGLCYGVREAAKDIAREWRGLMDRPKADDGATLSSLADAPMDVFIAPMNTPFPGLDERAQDFDIGWKPVETARRPVFVAGVCEVCGGTATERTRELTPPVGFLGMPTKVFIKSETFRCGKHPFQGATKARMTQ